MSYLVFARKWRPQTFDDVIGQGHIVTTLKNAILNKRVAHAYLFSGPRGTGKTTTARIFAKALNCKNGPTVSPCNKCASCAEITSGMSMDVIEIDGASNRSIDDIRNLRENVKFTPVNGNFKIYIIDEVHQISSDGFNALLKTLEEPPPHVKFIFATTQPQKVISTILSRCQRFDFKRLPTEEIARKLKTISKNESLNIKDEAIYVIARNSEGSMRDAESVLDQLASFGEGEIGKDDVNRILGVVGEGILFETLDYIASRDAKSLLLKLDTLLAGGADQFNLVSSLMEHTRNLMAVKLLSDVKTLEISKESIESFKKQCANFSEEELLYIFYIFSNALSDMKKFTAPRVILEMCLVKLCKRDDFTPIGEILEKLGNLEKRMSSGKIADSAGAKSPEIKKSIEAPKPPDKIVTEQAGTQNVITDPPLSSQEKKSDILFDDIKKIWHQAVRDIKSKKISVGIYLSDGAPHEIGEGALKIGFPKNLHKESLERPENKKLIEDTFCDLLKADIRVEFIVVQNLEKIESDIIDAPVEDEEGFYTEDGGLPASHSEPIINSALEIFSGKITKEKDSDQPSKH